MAANQFCPNPESESRPAEIKHCGPRGRRIVIGDFFFHLIFRDASKFLSNERVNEAAEIKKRTGHPIRFNIPTFQLSNCSTFIIASSRVPKRDGGRAKPSRHQPRQRRDAASPPNGLRPKPTGHAIPIDRESTPKHLPGPAPGARLRTVAGAGCIARWRPAEDWAVHRPRTRPAAEGSARQAATF